MNQRIYQRAVEISQALRPNNARLFFHTSFAVRKSRIVCIAVNNFSKLHNENRFGKYVNTRGYKEEYVPFTHSECSLISKLGEEDISDYEFLNIRITFDGKANMARPCFNCARVLASFGGPKKMFYSDSNGIMQQDERF